ncbi:MAG TPA: hypothetical protein VKV17_05400 [Bryobacteraceae bacterium]|nr:hypothetical protein [Bryobacteraceae bacterium]
MPRTHHQTSLYEESQPVLPGNALYCHQEFLEKLEQNRSTPVGRRAALLLHRLYVNLSRVFYKPTQGVNRGWRRSPLGGNHGSHFYAWWAPRGAAPLEGNGEFEGTPQGSVFLRDIRHHDDHRPLNAHSLHENYLPVSLRDLRQADYVPAPWTTQQARFAEARQKVRIIKGSPGSGKTTALWHAADLAGRRSILYVTYSPELAALAREHFDRFVPDYKQFRVITYGQLLREVLGSQVPFRPLRQARAEFMKEVAAFSATTLGPWLHEKAALYDEMHAHLFGAMLPEPVGRFAGFAERRVSARQYREIRERAIGRAAAEAVVEVAETLRRRDARPLERFFVELDLAWNAARQIRARGAEALAGVDCVALDEAQDLTPIESLAIVELVAALGRDVSFLVAGDEAQTLRPTDFEWGWFQDLIHHRLASPQDYRLQVNLRSPRRIAGVINRVWDLYGAIAKQERPGGAGAAEIDDNAGDQIALCAASAGPDLEELLEAFARREGLAMIALGDEIPAYVPERLRDRVLTSFEAKGLDFQSVCVLDAGKWLTRVLESREKGRGVELEDLHKRLAIDQLRVALSRPSERLYWVDVNPTERSLALAQNMLSFDHERAYPVVPAVLLKIQEEEALDVEERVRLCENDARQFLEVRPALAWSRARQAVALLGEPGSSFGVADRAARASAYMTLCQVAFTMAFRKLHLPAEMGRLDLYAEAVRAAVAADRSTLSFLIHVIAQYERATEADKVIPLLKLAELLSHEPLESWMLVELQPRAARWLEALEAEVPISAEQLYESLPPLYSIFVPAEAAERTARLRERAIEALMKMGNQKAALRILREMPDAPVKLIAECHEGMGELATAAEEYLRAGRPADALRCYRLIPDFDKALGLVETLGDHPARESLLWVRRMRDLAGERPAEFHKLILPTEKKVLEGILETSLGATRKKPATKRAGAPRKTAAAKKAAAGARPAAKRQGPVKP